MWNKHFYLQVYLKQSKDFYHGPCQGYLVGNATICISFKNILIHKNKIIFTKRICMGMGMDMETVTSSVWACSAYTEPSWPCAPERATRTAQSMVVVFHTTSKDLSCGGSRAGTSRRWCSASQAHRHSITLPYLNIYLLGVMLGRFALLDCTEQHNGHEGNKYARKQVS